MKKQLLLGLLLFYTMSAIAQNSSELRKEILGFLAKGEYEKAIPVAIEAINAAKKEYGEVSLYYSGSVSNLGSLYLQTSQFIQAEQFLTKAKAILKEIGGTSKEYLSTLNFLSVLYLKTGQYEKAESSIFHLIDLEKKIFGSNTPQYNSLNNQAELYLQIGQYEKAEPLFIQAKNISKQIYGETSASYPVSLNQLARLYMTTGQYQKAEPLFIQAKDIIEKNRGKNSSEFIASLNNLATVYIETAMYEKAEPLLIEAIENRRKLSGEENIDYASCLNNLAILYVYTGQYLKAEPLYIQVMNIREKVQGEKSLDYANSINNLGLFYLATNQYSKAEPLILRNNHLVLDNLIKIFPLLSEKEKLNYIKNNISLLETNNSFLYKQKEKSSSLLKSNINLLLFLKSLSLAATRNMIQQVEHSSDSVVKVIFNEWQKNKILLAKQYSLPAHKRIQSLASLELQTERLEKELSRKSTEFHSYQDAIKINMKDVQKKMDGDEACVEFVRFQLHDLRWTDTIIYAAYIFNKNDSIPAFVTLCEEKQLEQVFDGIGIGKTNDKAIKSFYNFSTDKKNPSRLFYKLVWQPLEPFLKEIKKISYSPAGKLHGIAFHALPVDDKTLLLNKYKLQQYTSIRQVAIRNEGSHNIRPNDIVLFGNPDFNMDSLQLTFRKKSNPESNVKSYIPLPEANNNFLLDSLPETAEEIKTITRLFEQNKLIAKAFTEINASEENLKSLSGNSPQILHVATHGFFYPQLSESKKGYKSGQYNTFTLADNPLVRSGLILAGGGYVWDGKTPIDGIEDGILTAYEISQLDLSNTKVVVLSACETALGDIKGSEGVFGLQRAFKMAGVEKMIVSLWQVPDKATVELMTEFYSHWIAGKTINDAFTQAQTDMRKKYSPYYWAAFVLVE